MKQLGAEAELKLLELRKQFEHIFFLAFNDLEALIRPLTFIEAKGLALSGDNLTPSIANEWVVNNCLLHSNIPLEELMTTAPAGYIDLIAEFIRQVSGFSGKEEFISGLITARNEVDIFLTLTESYICLAFKNLTPMDVRNMDFHKQMDYLSRAEIILGKPLDLEALFANNNKKGNKKGPPLKPGYKNLAGILSREAADMPNPEADNRALRDVNYG